MSKSWIAFLSTVIILVSVAVGFVGYRYAQGDISFVPNACNFDFDSSAVFSPNNGADKFLEEKYTLKGKTLGEGAWVMSQFYGDDLDNQPIYEDWNSLVYSILFASTGGEEVAQSIIAPYKSVLNIQYDCASELTIKDYFELILANQRELLENKTTFSIEDYDLFLYDTVENIDDKLLMLESLSDEEIEDEIKNFSVNSLNRYASDRSNPETNRFVQSSLNNHEEIDLYFELWQQLPALIKDLDSYEKDKAAFSEGLVNDEQQRDILLLETEIARYPWIDGFSKNNSDHALLAAEDEFIMTDEFSTVRFNSKNQEPLWEIIHQEKSDIEYDLLRNRLYVAIIKDEGQMGVVRGYDLITGKEVSVDTVAVDFEIDRIDLSYVNENDIWLNLLRTSQNGGVVYNLNTQEQASVDANALTFSENGEYVAYVRSGELIVEEFSFNSSNRNVVSQTQFEGGYNLLKFDNQELTVVSGVRTFGNQGHFDENSIAYKLKLDTSERVELDVEEVAYREEIIGLQTIDGEFRIEYDNHNVNVYELDSEKGYIKIRTLDAPSGLQGFNFSMVFDEAEEHFYLFSRYGGVHKFKL